jgi:hypothetical protein
MAIPTWTPGEVLTASDVNTWFVPSVAYKSSAQNVTSSTTLVNDTALFLPVTANAFYVFELFLFIEGGAGGSSDFKMLFAFPAGLTASYGGDYTGPAGTAQIGGYYQQNTTTSIGTIGAGNGRAARFSGSIQVSATAGNWQLTWAQNTSNATATTVEPGSYMMMQRIA